MTRIFTALLVCIAVCCTGQDTITVHKLKHSDIFPLFSKESKSAQAYFFNVGDEPMQPIGFQGANLEPYLKNHVEAYQTFLDYRVQTKRARTTSKIGAVAFGLGLGVLAATVSDDDVSDAVKGTSAGVMVAGFVINFIGGKTYRRARDTFERSMDIYNGGSREN